jgi:hypothetical protein
MAYLGGEKEAVGSAELLQADQLHQDGGGQRVVGGDAEPVHTRQHYRQDRNNHERMRSSRVVRASDCQCRSPGSDPSILRHSGI